MSCRRHGAPSLAALLLRGIIVTIANYLLHSQHGSSIIQVCFSVIVVFFWMFREWHRKVSWPAG